ncbi:hypothetical protein J6C36_01100 [Methanocorpusculaceae archaeon]|nr:hypothetical protein [Methanocorpusculaceae archaeon]MBO5432248.1 hypothetical protein [Methanocorpusculum sp.]
MSGKIIVSLTCPNCGGQVESEEGESLVLCKFCDSVFSLTTDEGIGKVMYRLDVTREKALSRLQEWMKEGPKAKDLASASAVSEAYPVYLPFWRLVGRGKACVCGIEIQKGDKDEPDRRIPHESLVNREYIYSDIACDPGDLGITAVRIPEHAAAVQFDDEAVVTFGVTESRDDAYQTGSEEIRRMAVADGKRSMDEVHFAKSFFFEKAFSLVYYPFWILRYTYQDRAYFAVLDGITAQVVSGRAPGSAGSQSTAAALGGTLAGAVLAAFIFFGFALGALEAIAILFAFGLIAAAGIIAFAYNRFRYGDEILEGAVKGKGLKRGRKQLNVETNFENTYDMFN